MAFQTGQASSIDDLMDKLNTFAVANGWTSNEFSTSTGKLSLERSTVTVNFLWADTSTAIAMSQSLGYSGAAGNIASHPDDSGGTVDLVAPHTTGKRLELYSVGPFPNYWFFEEDTYIHVVVEGITEVYTFMSFGIIEKFGTWTGGEYLTSSFFLAAATTTGSAQTGNADQTNHIFDGFGTTNPNSCSTMHIEGLPNMDGDSKWGVFFSDSDAIANDTAGEPRYPLLGGIRGGFMEPYLGHVGSSSGGAFTPLRPIPIFYRDRTPSPNHVYLLGYAPDVRSLNIEEFAPGVELTLGGDTWIPFPQIRKTFQKNVATLQSGFAGLAFKKNT